MRGQALAELQSRGPACVEAVPALIAELAKEGYSPHFSVERALVNIGKPAVPALISASQNPNQNIRAEAARMLVRFGPYVINIGKPAVPALISALQDPNAGVRAEAARLLGRIGPDAKQAIPMLLSVLRGRETDLRVLGNAVEALGKMGPDALAAILQGLQDPRWGRAKVMLVNVCESMGPAAAPAVPELIPMLYDEEGYPQVNIIETLGAIGPGAKDAVPALIELRKKFRGYSSDAAKALEKIGSPEALTATRVFRLREALNRRVYSVGERFILPSRDWLIGFVFAALAGLGGGRRLRQLPMAGLAVLWLLFATWNTYCFVMRYKIRIDLLLLMPLLFYGTILGLLVWGISFLPLRRRP